MVPSIVKSRSYLERDFLSGADARAAIAEPLSQTSVSVTDSLIARDAHVGPVRQASSKVGRP